MVSNLEIIFQVVLIDAKNWRYCTFVPPFLLMILAQNFMLIKNHIETCVLRSTETKLFTSLFKFPNPIMSAIVFKQLILVVTGYLVSERCFLTCWPINPGLCIQTVYKRFFYFSFGEFLIWREKMLFHLLMPFSIHSVNMAAALVLDQAIIDNISLLRI